MPDNHTLDAISDCIATARAKQGLSISELSKRSDVSRGTISAIEGGELGTVGSLRRVLREFDHELRAMPLKARRRSKASPKRSRPKRPRR